MSAAAKPEVQRIEPFGEVYAGATHAAREAIITVDELQRIVIINPAALRMFGCTAAQAFGAEFQRFVPAADRAGHARWMAQFDEPGAAELAMGPGAPITLQRANGEVFTAQATIARVDTAHDLKAGRYDTLLLRDLSEERDLRYELEALRARMRAIFELAPIAIWITDGDSIVFANRACAALFGAGERGALVGRSIYSLLSRESQERVRRVVEQALADQDRVPTVAERIARLDGAVRDVEIAVAALPDHGQTAVQMVITDVTERNRESQELERSRRELRRLSASLVEAREEERLRIARELHDELGQRLTALKMELADLAAPSEIAAPDPRITAMLEMIDETVASVRRIATDLRPLMLDDLGLTAAIEWLIRDSARRMGIEFTLHIADVDALVDSVTAIALYRMVQEAVTNIARHAAASAARVTVERDAEDLVLTVQDNGKGFAEQSMQREGSHGLMGIRERARMLGGQLEIGNLPQGGGRVSVRLPLRRPDKPRSRGAARAAAAS